MNKVRRRYRRQGTLRLDLRCAIRNGIKDVVEIRGMIPGNSIAVKGLNDRFGNVIISSRPLCCRRYCLIFRFDLHVPLSVLVQPIKYVHLPASISMIN